jgi:hypothetical protein
MRVPCSQSTAERPMSCLANNVTAQSQVHQGITAGRPPLTVQHSIVAGQTQGCRQQRPPVHPVPTTSAERLLRHHATGAAAAKHLPSTSTRLALLTSCVQGMRAKNKHLHERTPTRHVPKHHSLRLLRPFLNRCPHGATSSRPWPCHPASRRPAAIRLRPHVRCPSLLRLSLAHRTLDLVHKTLTASVHHLCG